jgi:hypothetical protein
MRLPDFLQQIYSVVTAEKKLFGYPESEIPKPPQKDFRLPSMFLS